MSTVNAARAINPRLGAYFGIFASAFISLFLVGLIFSELGTNPRLLTFVILLVPMGLYLCLAIASLTNTPREFFAAGRRVPAICNGAVIGLGAYGGVGVVTITGLFYAHGFDAWSLVLGMIGGLILMGILIAPYYRKFGSFTVPSFLGRRLESQTLRLVASAVLVVPMLLVLIAELSLGVWLARQLTGSQERWMLVILIGTAALTLTFGGMRAASWSITAQAIAVLIAVIAVSGIAGLWFTYLPLAQLSHGPLLNRLGLAEAASGVPLAAASPLSFELAGREPVALLERFAEPFTAMGHISFGFTTLVVMLGIAGAPWLVPRCTTTPGVHAARKSLGWAVFLLGFLGVSLSAVAVFLRDLMLAEAVGRSSESLPAWFAERTSSGLAAVTSSVPALPPSGLALHRDIVLFTLPDAGGFPPVLELLAFAGALAAVVAAVTLTMMSIAAVLSEDVLSGLRWEPHSRGLRLFVARFSILIVLLLGGSAAMVNETDPLELVLWALSLSAATGFPVLGLAIWHKRLTAIAALAALVSGFLTTTVAILIIELAVSDVPSIFAGIAGFVVATVSGLVVSRLTPRPSRLALEHVRDMRIPGGETIYDREMRLLRLKEKG